MANNSNSSGSGSKGLGFTGALQIVFIVLKLLGKINWSWLWVLSPTWISLILTIVIVIIFHKVMFK
jgi:hypothetical protein